MTRHFSVERWGEIAIPVLVDKDLTRTTNLNIDSNFRGKPAFSSYKTTLNQQLNGEKGDV